MAERTDNAKKFIAANKRSPVVSGYAIGKGGEGAVYTLRSGERFELTRDECRSMPMPEWVHDFVRSAAEAR